MPQTLQAAWTRLERHTVPWTASNTSTSIAGVPGEVSLQQVTYFFPFASYSWCLTP